MSRALWNRTLAGLCTLAVSAALAVAQEPAKKPEGQKPAAGQPQVGKAEGQKGQPEGMPSAEQMEKIMAVCSPGPEHQRLAKLVGNWNLELRSPAPGADPNAMKGTATYKSVYDGRFVQQEVSAPPMMGDQPFRGMGWIGYDGVRKQYVSTWIDNMCTGILVTYGKEDPAGKTITFTGEMSDPMTGKMDTKVREVVRIESDDKHVFEMYGPGPDGKEVKQFEITYTRAK